MPIEVILVDEPIALIVLVNKNAPVKTGEILTDDWEHAVLALV
jgi:hypothetical protein